jgi:hypothetical protein
MGRTRWEVSNQRVFGPDFLAETLTGGARRRRARPTADRAGAARAEVADHPQRGAVDTPVLTAWFLVFFVLFVFFVVSWLEAFP